MKKIKAVIQEFMLPKVVEALQGHPEFPGLTLSRVPRIWEGWNRE